MCDPVYHGIYSHPSAKAKPGAHAIKKMMAVAEELVK
jgi:hypothetical protein